MATEEFLNYLCDLCNKTYKKESALDIHLLRYHKVKSDKLGNHKAEPVEQIEDENDDELMEKEDRKPIENKDDDEERNELVQENKGEQKDKNYIATIGFGNAFENVKIEKNESVMDENIETIDNHSEALNGKDTTEIKDTIKVETIKSEGKPNIQIDTKKKGAGAKVKEFGTSLSSPENRRSFGGLFTKHEGDIYYCNQCTTQYKCLGSVKRHLEKTTCGFGSKKYVPLTTNKDFTGMYMKTDDCIICNGCAGKFKSLNGVHLHLRNQNCGRESSTETDSWSCLSCNKYYKQLSGLRQHLNISPDCVEAIGLGIQKIQVKWGNWETKQLVKEETQLENIDHEGVLKVKQEKAEIEQKQRVLEQQQQGRKPDIELENETETQLDMELDSLDFLDNL